ncbi:MAG: YciI family protein [Stenotrophobium sp.]
MLYVILGHDAPGTLAARLQLRLVHRDRIKQLQAQGRLVIAGPRPAIEAADPGEAGYFGSLIIAEFDSLQSARDWAESDPYFKVGVFKSMDVQPFVRALP